jgi:DNA-binding NarL/FixJ family response regulator
MATEPLRATISRMKSQTLTAREVEVIRLIARGLSNRDIASALGTVEGTVKNQASSILHKLGVPNRVGAVLRATQLGLLA